MPSVTLAADLAKDQAELSKEDATNEKPESMVEVIVDEKAELKEMDANNEKGSIIDEKQGLTKPYGHCTTMEELVQEMNKDLEDWIVGIPTRYPPDTSPDAPTSSPPVLHMPNRRDLISRLRWALLVAHVVTTIMEQWSRPGTGMKFSSYVLIGCAFMGLISGAALLCHEALLSEGEVKPFVLEVLGSFTQNATVVESINEHNRWVLRRMRNWMLLGRIGAGMGALVCALIGAVKVLGRTSKELNLEVELICWLTEGGLCLALAIVMGRVRRATMAAAAQRDVEGLPARLHDLDVSKLVEELGRRLLGKYMPPGMSSR